MKKMSFMRMAALMLLLCLASTCAISGTFAKYTSTATGSDNARVAKWGWDTTTLAVDMFDTAYATDVKSGDTTNVIAPGTTATKQSPSDPTKISSLRLHTVFLSLLILPAPIPICLQS